MDLGISGKVALVLGGGGGLGGAIGVALAREGVRVALASTDGTSAERVAQTIRAPGGEAISLAWNLNDLDVIEARIADIARFANTVDPLPNRVVRVNGPPLLISQFLAPRLLPLQGKHPGLRIELLGETRQVSLGQGGADLALRMSRPAEKGVTARKLAVVAYGLYASRDYLARCGGEGRDFLGFDDSLDQSPQQRWLKKLAGERGFTLRSNDITNLLTAARAGLGLVVLPCIVVRNDPNMVRVPTPLPPLTRELWLLFHRDVGRTPAVRAVIDHIIAIMTQAKAAFREDGSSGAAG